ncbi:MAG TPA: hypothetical protein VF862_08425 [Gemmatimonadales bacterium]
MTTRFRFVAGLCAGWLAAASLPARAHAQLPPLTVPKGHLRMDLGGSFATWDRRFRQGQSEDAAQDFIRDAVGSDFWPGLKSGDSLLARITGITGALNLGSTTASQHVFVGSTSLGLAYGLTSRLTLFGTVPFRRVQVRSTLSQDSTTGTAGFNPADPTFGDGSGATQDASFFAQFDAALSSLQGKLNSGFYDSDPAAKQLAEQTLAAGAGLRTDLFALLLDPATASPFLPTASSTPGGAILQKVATLQAALTGLAVTGFTLVPALPSSRVGSSDFEDFVTNSSGPVVGSLTVPVLTALGDVEVGAAYLFLDRRRDDAVSSLRVAGQALFRLRTAQLDNPSRFFDVGTGDRQPDLELGMAADLRQGRLGARLSGSYNLQLAGDAQKRIAPPSVPMPWAITLANVVRTPGNELRLGVQPFFALSRTFAIAFSGQYVNHGADSYTLFEGQPEIPGYPVEQLAEESQSSWIEASAGVTFAAPFEIKGDRPHRPLDAGVAYHTVVSASGGRVPRAGDLRLFMRYYAKFP